MEKLRCGCMLAVLLFNLALGGWSVNFLLELIGKNIHWVGDVLIGLFMGQFTVPIAAVIWLLKAFGAF